MLMKLINFNFIDSGSITLFKVINDAFLDYLLIYRLLLNRSSITIDCSWLQYLYYIEEKMN